MFQSLGLEGVVSPAEIHNVKWAKSPKSFKVFADSLHNRAGDGLRAENPDIDV